jgi:hypothetical protein
MTTDPLSQAVQLIKAGNKPAALPLLKQLIQAEPDNELAWQWLYSCVDDVSQKKYCLKKVLEINPNNTNARNALEKLSFVDNLTPIPQGKPAAPASSLEKTFYQAENVLVTSHRVVFGGDTHVVRNITSVSAAKLPPNRKAGRIIAVVSFLVAMCIAVASNRTGQPNFIPGIIMFLGLAGTVVGLVLSFTAKPRFGVSFVSGSGVINGLISTDQKTISDIVSAINQAIVEKN